MVVSPETVVVVAAVAAVSAVATAWVAGVKGYSRPAFLLLGLLFGCVGLVIALVLPDAGSKVTAGSVARVARRFPLDGGEVLERGFATRVYELAVKDGTPAALVDGPDGARYWVPLRILR